MAAERFCLTTVVILFTVFVILDRKLMANISIILTNNSVIKVPKSYSLAGQQKNIFLLII